MRERESSKIIEMAKEIGYYFLSVNIVYGLSFVHDCQFMLCGLLWIGICRINASWKEIALDAIGIADTYLDMVLFRKSCIGIE